MPRRIRLLALVVTVAWLATSCLWLNRVTEPSRAEANGSADRPVVSADGRWVAFQSASTNLVEKDDNGRIDVFVADRTTGATTLISRDAQGRAARGDSTRPDISSDGRFITFQTTASLQDFASTIADSNGVDDVVRVDRDTDGDGLFDEAGTTAVALVSINNSLTNAVGGSLPHIDGSGTQIAFATPFGYSADTNGVSDVYDWFFGQGWFPISARGNGCYADDNDLAADGASAVFVTNCPVVSADTNGFFDIYRRDLATDVMTLASVASGGAVANSHSFGPVLSADGANLVWSSNASTFSAGDLNGHSDVFRRTFATDTTVRVSNGTAGVGANGDSTVAAVSSDGATIAFSSLATNLVPGDTNGRRDVFVWSSGTTTRVSVAGAATQANGDSVWLGISGDGRYVVFGSDATNLVTPDGNGATSAFIRDRTASTTARVDKPPASDPVDMVGGSPDSYALSGDGRYLVFSATARNLLAGVVTGAVYVRDLASGVLELIPGGRGGGVDISADGRYVAFESDQALSPIDTNGVTDVYVRDRVAGSTDLVSQSTTAIGGNKGSIEPSMSADGMVVAFRSAATNLSGLDVNGHQDIFVRDRANQRTAMASVTDAGDLFTQFCEVCDHYATSYAANLDPSGTTVVFTELYPDSTAPLRPGWGQTYARTDIFSATPHTVTFGPEGSGISAARSIVWGPGGRRVIRAGANGAIVEFDISSGVSTQIATGAPIDISADGRFLAVVGSFDDPVPNDLDDVTGVYVVDRVRNRRYLVSTDPNLALVRGTALVGSGTISADGRTTAFLSTSGAVVAGDGNADYDLFVRATVPPSISSLLPSTLARGTTQTLTINGDDFLAGPVPTLTLLPADGVTFGPVVYVNPNRITVSVTVAANAPTGVRNLFVTNTGTGPGGLNGNGANCNCLTIS